jgi:hypothetical protein
LKEIRSLKEHFSEYDQTGIRFYCITDDTPEKIAVMRANMPSTIAFLHATSLNEMGVYTIPASFFYLNNELIDKRLDAIDWQDKTSIIETFNSN